MKKLEIILLLLIISLGFLLRLYKFDAPIADWHSWRQVDTSSVSRNFVNSGFDLLHPKFDDLSNVQTGVYDNPQGLRFVEFPIYNVLQAGAFLTFNIFTLEQWGRLISIFSSSFASIFIFLILKRHSKMLVALLGAFFYSFLPFNIFWGRTVLPDSLAIAATLAAIYFFDLYKDQADRKNKKKFLFSVLTILFTSLAILIKPFAGFFLFPAVFLAWSKWGKDIFKRVDLWVITIVSILPFVFWRVWMMQYPEGIPQAGWLFNGSNIRFKGAFFHWIFAQRIGELILGFWGIALLVIGILIKKENKFYLSFLLSSIFYLFLVATGNVMHSYYQILIMPSISIFLALGSYFLINPPKQYISRNISIFIFLICTGFMFAFSWFQVRDYYNIQNPSIVIAGEAVDRLTPKDSKIIALYDGDTTLLYHTKRKGWASFSKPIEGLIKAGATHLLIVNPNERDLDFAKKYKLLDRTPQYLIFEL